LCNADSKSTAKVLNWVENKALAQEISQGISRLIKISAKNSEKLSAQYSFMS
jgi:hypothetical protein